MDRQILITVLLSVFIALLGIGIIVPVMPVFATELGANGISLAMIIAAFSISRGLLQPAVGNWSDRLGRKRFLIAGLFVYGIVGLLIPHATSVHHLVLIRAFHGVGSAMIVPIAMAYMGSLAPQGQEGRYMGLLNIAIFCGIGCGPVLGGVLFDAWGLASVFHVMAGLCFTACILVIRNMPVQPLQDPAQRRRLLQSMILMARRRRTLGILIARCATMVMMVPTMAFLPLLMHGWPGSSGLQIGIVIACRTLVNALLQVPFGKLADRRDKVVLLAAGTVWMGSAIILVPQAVNFPWMVLIYMLLGAGEAVIWPVLGAFATEEGREHFGHGTMMGVFNLAMSTGVFLGAMLGGTAMDVLGMSWAFRVNGAVVIGVTLFAALLIRSGERQTVGA